MGSESHDITGFGKVAEQFQLSTKEIRETLQFFLSPIAKESGEWIADHIRIARIKNVQKVLQLAKAELEVSGIPNNAVETKVLVPLLESCSLEQDEDMVQRWAKLLVRATTGDPVLPSYIRILSELSPQGAQMLDAINASFSEHGVDVNLILFPPDVGFGQVQPILLNLQRLDLIHAVLPAMHFGTPRIGANQNVTNGQEFVAISPFGREFLRACTGM